MSSPVQQWLRGSSPLSKTLLAITVTTIVVFTNKWVYAPYAKRQRYKQAEAWANQVFEEEEQNENSSTNLSY